MSDPKRLTDEQVREIKKLLDSHAPPRATYLNQMSDLLADREASMAQLVFFQESAAKYNDALGRCAAVREQLRAENAKLWKVVEASRPFETSGEWGTRMAMITNGAATRDEGIAHCKVIVRAQRNLCDALDALDAKDATDDKQRR